MARDMPRPVQILMARPVLRRRNDIYRARKQRGIAMAAYLTKYRGTQYRRLNTLHSCTASKFGETWLKSSLAICYYEKGKELADICDTRR